MMYVTNAIQYNTIHFTIHFISLLMLTLQYNIIHIARDKRKEKEKEDPEKKREAIDSGSTWQKLSKHSL